MTAVEIPEWIGKQQVPEDRHTTLELLEVWAKLVNEIIILPDERLREDAFLDECMSVGKFLQMKRSFSDAIIDVGTGFQQDVTSSRKGIYIGFPRTRVGQLNAMLVGAIWRVYDEK